MTVTIRRIRCIPTAPDGVRLVVVKVETSEPDLYGLGCATFTQRPLSVITAVDEYLDPFLRGRDVQQIEDIHQASTLSSYWRGGPVLNNAISGVDMALWDIKAKRAGMPVYELLGGKCRAAADVYLHASGRDYGEVIDNARRLMETRQVRFVRLQVEVPGQATYGTSSDLKTSDVNSPTTPHNVFEPADYARLVPGLFEHARSELGDQVELLHDIHERLPVPLAVRLANDLEPFGLYFLEDALPPEELDHFRRLRQASSIPLAMGELFTDVNQYLPLIRHRLIDFIRCHLSFIGGLTPARKLAALCEYFGVRSAWHGPPDTSPIGHAANLALDLTIPNFGVQEFSEPSERMLEAFPGCHQLRDGRLWPHDQPGWGIDIDEQAARHYPFPDHPFNGAWPAIRRRDGGIVRP